MSHIEQDKDGTSVDVTPLREVPLVGWAKAVHGLGVHLIWATVLVLVTWKALGR